MAKTRNGRKSMRVKSGHCLHKNLCSVSKSALAQVARAYALENSGLLDFGARL